MEFIKKYRWPLICLVASGGFLALAGVNVLLLAVMFVAAWLLLYVWQDAARAPKDEGPAAQRRAAGESLASAPASAAAPTGLLPRYVALFISSADEIKLDGKPTTLAELREILTRYVADGDNVIVNCERERVDHPPTTAATEAMEMITKCGLRINVARPANEVR